MAELQWASEIYGEGTLAEESDEEPTWTPLQLAAFKGNINLAQSLLSQGTDPNEPPLIPCEINELQ